MRRLSTPDLFAAASKFHGPALRHLGAAAALAILALMLSSAARAVPVYTASAGGACGSDTHTGGTHQFAAVVQSLCPSTAWYYGNASAQAGSGGVGASVDSVSFCCGSSSVFGASALAKTEMMITGPAGSGPIEVSLNLALDAGFRSEVVTGYSDRNLRYTVELGNLLFEGAYRQVASSSGLTFTYSGNIPQQIYGTTLLGVMSTPKFQLPVNTLISFNLFLEAWVDQSGNATGAVSAFDTLYFPLDRPVFNLPDGYSAAIYGLNVIDNRVAGGGGNSVPEPGTLGLLAAGLLGLLGVISRRRRGA